LAVGRSNSVGANVGANRFLVVTEARLENVGSVGSRHVVVASKLVVDVLAVVEVGGIVGRASLEAEHARSHEVVPLRDLLDLASESGRVDQATKWVTTAICSVRIKLSSTIVGIDVDHLLIDETDNLDVSGSRQPLYTGDGTSGDDTGAVTGLGAPCDLGSFRVADGAVGSGRSPQAEVVDAVDPGGLAVRVGPLGGRVANVVSN